LKRSVGSKDAREVAASAHKIKGAAANVSAEDIRRVAAELEQLGKADALEQAQTCLDQLHQELNRFRQHLGTALAQLEESREPGAATQAGQAPAGQ
jgi:HPt (histidine-containing phosphotransfer) domain-containing protein